MPRTSAPERLRGLPADFAWLVGGYVLRSLAWLATATLLARELAPAGFGELSLFMALAAAIGYLAGSWPFLSLPTAAAEGRPLGPVLKAAMTLAAGAAVLCACAVVPVAIVMLGSGPAEIVLLLVYSLGLITLQGVYGLLQARGRMPGIAGTQAAERVLTLAVVGVVALTAGLTVGGAELALALAAVALGGVVFIGVRRGELEEPSAPPTRPQALLSLVGPMAVVTVCSYAVAWVDVLILGALASDADVGRYALAYQAFTFVAQLATLSIVAALPRHARGAAAGASSAAVLLPSDKLLRVTAGWSAVAGLFAVGGAVALVPLFGDAYEPGIGPLALLLAGLALTAPYYALVPVVVALERTYPLAVISAVSVAINVVAGIALVPIVGIWGPAAATVAQALVASAALVVRELGTARALRLAAVALPGSLAAVCVAAASDDGVVLGIAALLAATTLVASAAWPLRTPAPA